MKCSRFKTNEMFIHMQIEMTWYTYMKISLIISLMICWVQKIISNHCEINTISIKECISFLKKVERCYAIKWKSKPQNLFIIWKKAAFYIARLLFSYVRQKALLIWVQPAEKIWYFMTWSLEIFLSLSSTCIMNKSCAFDLQNWNLNIIQCCQMGKNEMNFLILTINTLKRKKIKNKWQQL